MFMSKCYSLGGYLQSRKLTTSPNGLYKQSRVGENDQYRHHSIISIIISIIDNVCFFNSRQFLRMLDDI